MMRAQRDFPERREEPKQDPIKPAPPLNGPSDAGASQKAAPARVFVKNVRGGTVVSALPFEGAVESDVARLERLERENAMLRAEIAECRAVKTWGDLK